MSKIPVIDLAPILAGGDPLPAARAIDAACREVGFFQVVGHGIPTALYDAAYAACDAVSALPLEDREALRSPTGHPFRGYFTKHTDTGRLVMERMQMNHFDDEGAAITAGVDAKYADYFDANIWPDVPGFAESWHACLDETRKVGALLMELFALGLGFPRDHFTPYFRQDATNFTTNRYLPRGEEVGNGDRDIVGMAHTDSGTLTLLHQRGDFCALEVEVLQGEWVRVPFDDDTLTINIGDLMARWTNDLWRSTPHRVVGAPDGESTRTSLVAFYSPSVDSVIEPLETLLTGAPLYPPVLAYDWEDEFLSRFSPRRRVAV